MARASQKRKKVVVVVAGGLLVVAFYYLLYDCPSVSWPVLRVAPAITCESCGPHEKPGEKLSEAERRVRRGAWQLRRACARRGVAPVRDLSFLPYEVEEVVTRTQVLEEERLAACVPHKTGSTAWNFLMTHRFCRTDLQVEHTYYKMIDHLRPTTERFEEVMYSAKFERLVVVREPLERLLSAYFDRIVDRSQYKWQAYAFVPLILMETRGITYTEEELFFPNLTVKIIPSFTEFVQFVTSRSTVDQDPHWRPVTSLCGLCYIDYTAVARTDTLLDDLTYVMSFSGLDKRLSPDLLTRNPNRGRKSTKASLVAYYAALPTHLLQAVVNLYRDDFLLLGFDPTDLLRQISPKVRIPRRRDSAWYK